MRSPQTSTMAESVSNTFPTLPKLKPKSRTPSKTPEVKYWSSFKTHQISDLISSVPSISFSPSHPHIFAAAHSTTLSIFSPTSLPSPTSAITTFSDVVSSISFRSDGSLLAASDLSGVIKVFDIKSRTPLRHLRSHSRPVRFVKYPHHDKLHLVSGGDDAVVKYWDVVGETVVLNLQGHKDYVRSGDCSPVDSNVFITGSYDHTVKLWDVRVENSKSMMDVNHGNPVEDVIFLPSGGLVATAGGDTVKIWDMIGGGKLVYSMESHNKTVTSICVGKTSNDSAEESQPYRILSVALDGYMKVFDYTNMKITHSVRFPAPLMSIALSPDCMTRVIGTSNGTIYAGKRKVKEGVKIVKDSFWQLGSTESKNRVLKPPSLRYFNRGQSEKPNESDYLVMRPKKVKFAEHDKLLKKFRHKEALVSVLSSKNRENVMAVMEELVARKKLLKCVMILDAEELGLLLNFLHKYSTFPRYASLMIGLAKKVIEMRSEDIKTSEPLKAHIRKLKGLVEEEIRIQQSLQEINGIISPLLRITARR